MTLHIYCYNKTAHRYQAHQFVPRNYHLWTEVDLAEDEMLLPAKEAADKVIKLYTEKRLTFFVTASDGILGHILNWLAEESPNTPHKIFWYNDVECTFTEARLCNEGYLINWPFGYLL